MERLEVTPLDTNLRSILLPLQPTMQGTTMDLVSFDPRFAAAAQGGERQPLPTFTVADIEEWRRFPRYGNMTKFLATAVFRGTRLSKKFATRRSEPYNQLHHK